MSQASVVVASGPGAAVRAAMNAAFQSLVTCNAGATAPSPTYSNMLWHDTSTSLLKQRTNANDGWTEVALNATDTDGTLAANSDSKIATQKATKTYADTKIASSYLDTDGTLAGNSDTKIATQKATKTYADTKFSKSVSGEIAALTEKTSLVDDDLILIEDSQASNAKKKVKRSNLAPTVTFSSVVGSYTAGNYLLFPNPSPFYNNTSSSYVKVYEVLLPRGGTLRVKFWLHTEASQNASGRIYRNGSAVGTDRNIGPSTNTQFSEDISGWSAGDLLQLYIADNTNTLGILAGGLQIFTGTPVLEGGAYTSYPSSVVWTAPSSNAPAPWSTLGNPGDIYVRPVGGAAASLYIKYDSTNWSAR